MVTPRQKLTAWGEAYLFETSTPGQKLLSFLLLPLSWLYCLIVWIKKRKTDTYIPPLPVISIGNLTVGGSGKTPTTVELARHYQKSAVVLRGFGRKSKGLRVVKSWETILENVETAGDEAMVYAKALNDSLVIVAEDRVLGIEKAKELGAELVFLDDGHSKYHIQKLDILIKPDPEPASRRCLPSGAYREPYAAYNEADFVLEEKSGIKRTTRLLDPSEKMVLVTAIAKPARLDPFLPDVMGKVYYEDHHFFTKAELQKALNDVGADRILCTAKDAVKMEQFALPLSILELDVHLDDALFGAINAYLGNTPR